jgi:hypothetical protein
MVSFGMLRRVALVRTDVSEELSASIRVTRIGELGTTLAVTSNRCTLRRNTKCANTKSHTALHPRRHYSSESNVDFLLVPKCLDIAAFSKDLFDVSQ